MHSGVRKNLKNVSVNDILRTFVKPPYRMKWSSFSWQYFDDRSAKINRHKIFEEILPLGLFLCEILKNRCFTEIARQKRVVFKLMKKLEGSTEFNNFHNKDICIYVLLPENFSG